MSYARIMDAQGLDPSSTPAGSPTACANCGTARAGPFCHECGQHERMVHDSILHLIAQAAEHLTNTDGRLLRSLKMLSLHPDRLTREYLAGRRVSQLQPLSMFLTMLVIFLFTADRAVNVQFGLPAGQTGVVPPAMQWIVPIGRFVHDHDAAYLSILRQSAEWFGLLTVPVAAILLWGIFAGSKRSLYAHLIFAMHSLTFQLIIVGIFLALPDSAPSLCFWMLFFIMSAHLFRHMGGVYGGSRFAVLARMGFLAVGTFVAYLVLMLAWFGVAYFELR